MPQPKPKPVRLEGITKSYSSGLVACRNVSLDLYPGEIHALVGENGAGKTTLMNILFGLTEPDEGQIIIDGRSVRHRSPAEAIANGVGMVHQHFKLVPSFTVAENLTLAGVGRFGVKSARRLDRGHIGKLADRYGLDVNADSPINALPLSVQQRVEILKALYLDVRVLILDEPTTILNPKEIERLYDTLLRIAREGRVVVVVTHHMQEVFAFSDRVSVMRHGETVGSALTAQMTHDQVAHLIVGRKVEANRPFPRGPDVDVGDAALRFDRVSGGGEGRFTELEDVDFSVHRGEVVAIAGVEGNGQRALFDLAAALRQPNEGAVEVGPDRVKAQTRAESASLGVRIVPEDRHIDGLVLDLTVSENLLLDCVDRQPFAAYGRLNLGQIAEHSRDLLVKFNIRAAGIHVRARSLSGGNQQKVVLARAMRDGSPILVAYQPTRGLDIGATEELLSRLRAAANGGAAVLMISSNLDEIMRIADRIIVLYRGRIIGVTAGEDASLDTIGGWMTGAGTA